MNGRRQGAPGEVAIPRPGEIELAANRIAKLVRRTPTLTVDGREFGVDARISLKLEFLQQSGSFKARGAANFMLSNRIGEAGVVAASGGNHGAAVAWAARELGHRATIFIPTITDRAKVERLHSYGAEVHQAGDVYADALRAAIEFQHDLGATPIHAYEDVIVVTGAATTGREFAEQVGAVDTMLVACGGGGLAGGIAAWFGSSRTRIVACETVGTASFAQALQAGQPVDVAISGLAADALGASRIGTIGWTCLRAADAGSVVVTDDEVTTAGQLLWDRFRIVAEPSAVVPLAALISGRYEVRPGQHIGVIICGANTAL